MRINRNVKFILNWLMVGLLTSLLAHFIVEFLQRFGFTNSIPHVQLLLLGTGILFVLYVFISALLGSSVLGGLALIITAIIVGTINRTKIYYRAEPIFPNDFIFVKEVPFFVEMVGWLNSILIILAVGLGLALIVRFYQRKLELISNDIPRKTLVISRVLSVLVSGYALIYLSNFYESNHAIRTFYFNKAHWTFEQQLIDYQNNGFIAGFLANIEGAPMEEPRGYSQARVVEIYEKYNKLASEINSQKNEAATDTNIFFVMNESFSDPFNLEGISSNKDPLSHFRAITSGTLNGKILSPTFGGGTNASEFQALTGFSLEPLNPQITSPYMQLTESIGRYPTIVAKLNDLNYQTTAIHPYNKYFFKRDRVYDKMGFDMFLHNKNMVNKEKVSESHFFISDQSAYKEVFEAMNASAETDFIHVVTMQNHTPYAGKYDDVEYYVTGSGNADEANSYFQDLANSDQALGELIDRINYHPEPILLFFWGDHLPGFYRGEIREMNDEFTFRETPLFVYSNRIDLKGEIGTTSPIYFNNWVNELLDFQLTAYDALLLKLEEELPVIDDGMYLGHGERWTSRKELSPEELEVLEEYSLIMYDITMGEQYSKHFGFFE